MSGMPTCPKCGNPMTSSGHACPTDRPDAVLTDAALIDAFKKVAGAESLRQWEDRLAPIFPVPRPFDLAKFREHLIAYGRAVEVAVRAERREPPTDIEINATWNEVMKSLDGPNLCAFGRALLAKFGSAGVSEAEARERERKAAYDALTTISDLMAEEPGQNLDGAKFVAWYRNAHFAPKPPAPEAETLSDGSVVWRTVGGDWARGGSVGDGWQNIAPDWPDILQRPTDTGSDFEAVKGLAARLATREGK